MKPSVLRKLSQKSPLGSLKVLKNEGTSKKEKSLLFSINLTTLIDAFCILVIFLLSNMNGKVQNLKISDNLVLPAAIQTDELADGVVVRIEKDVIYLDDKKISKENIAKALLDAKKTENAAVIIQADRQSDYENVGLVLRAGGQAGFEKYAFAVLPGM